MLKETNIPIELITPTFDKDNLNFEIKIGGTIYEVHPHFSIEGKQSVLEQFKNIILSQKLI